MLVKQWIREALQERYITFDHINQYVTKQALAIGMKASMSEIKINLEKLIKENVVETHQYLAEEKYYSKTIYDKTNIYWYFFTLKE